VSVDQKGADGWGRLYQNVTQSDTRSGIMDRNGYICCCLCWSEQWMLKWKVENSGWKRHILPARIGLIPRAQLTYRPDDGGSKHL
jgi:hypothetical protein